MSKSLITQISELGYSCFPCWSGTNTPQDKKPRIGWKRYQSESPTPRDIARWERKFPGCNVGIPTGWYNKFVVLDVDADTEEGQRVLAEKELPITVSVRTSSENRFHLYYQHPGIYVPNFVKRLPGLDFRGDGGYVMAPGSRHPNGSLYDWINHRSQFPHAGMPAWLLDLVLENAIEEEPLKNGSDKTTISRANTYAEKAIEMEIAPLRGYVKGSEYGNDALNKAAFNLGQLVGMDLLDRSRVEHELYLVSQSMGQEHREALGTIKSGIDAGIKKPRTHRVTVRSAVPPTTPPPTNGTVAAADDEFQPDPQLFPDHSPAIENAPTLHELAASVSDKLNKKGDRAQKEKVSKMIIRWLQRHDRLLCDTSNPDEPLPYLLSDTGESLLLHDKSKVVQFHLSETSVNGAEPFYKWLLNDLQATAIQHGRKVKLERWSTLRNDVLYISSGKSHIVKASHGKLELVTNGTDDIIFAGEACFPSWKPCEPVPLRKMQGFKPALETPNEVSEYDPDAQMVLLEAWMIGVLMNIKPLPILTHVGQQGSGKSTTAKVIVRVFLGSGGDLGAVPSKQGNFDTAITALPVYGIDNLDQPEDVTWLPDALASACTGGTVMQRRLYTNGDLYQKKISAALLITTRTGTFAQRTDLAERTLPLFFGTLEIGMDERDIYAEIDCNRSALLSWLTREAAVIAADASRAEGFQGRFQAFAKIATRDPDEAGRLAVRSWIKAQRLAVTDLDPLMEALLKVVPQGPLEGTASEIVKSIEARGAFLPDLGGGKAISRKLRELAPMLKMAGIRLSTETKMDRAHFSIRVDAVL